MPRGVGLAKRCRAGLLLEESYLQHGLSTTPEVSCPIVVVVGSEDTISLEEAEKWERFTTREFRLHTIANGEHMFMQQPHSMSSEEERGVYDKWTVLFKEILATSLRDV